VLLFYRPRIHHRGDGDCSVMTTGHGLGCSIYGSESVFRRSAVVEAFIIWRGGGLRRVYGIRERDLDQV